MAQLSNQEFYDKWVPLLADNVFQDINGARFEQLLEDLRDSFANQAGQAAQPVPPAVNFDPATRQLTAQHPLGPGELEVTHNNGGFSAYAPLQVDDLVHALGEWRFRVKGATGRNASQLTDSPAIGAKQTSGAAGPLSILASQISDSSAVGRNLLRATTYGKQLQFLDNLDLDDYPQFARAYTEQGAIKYLLDQVAQLNANASPAAPPAPTAGQVDDTANTFSVLAVPGFTNFVEYVYYTPDSGGVKPLQAPVGYQSGSRITLGGLAGSYPPHTVGLAVAASGNRPQGAFCTNDDAFTGTATTTPPTTTTPAPTTVTAYVGAFSSSPPSAAEVLAATSQQWDKAGRSLHLVCENQRPGFAEPKSQGVRATIADGNGFDITSSVTRSSLVLNGVDYWLYLHNLAQYDSDFIFQLPAAS